MGIIKLITHGKVTVVSTAILVLSFLLNYQFSFAQQREIDSLKNLYTHTTANDTNRVILLNKLAYDYYTTNLDDLKVYSRLAVNLATKLKYRKGLAFAYKNVGLGYLADHANATALVYFDKSLTIFKSLKDKLNSAKVLNNFGYYYGIIKEHENELNYLLQAYNECKSLNNIMVKSVILGNIGNAYESSGDLLLARQYYNQQLNMSQEGSLIGGVVESYANLASVSFKEKRYMAALSYADKVLDIKKNSDNFKPRDLANIYTTQGKIYYNLKEYDKARTAFNNSNAVATNLGNAEFVSQNYYHLYLLDSLKKDYRSALTNYTQYSKLEDSLINLNKSQVLAQYQAKYDLQKRIAEMERLKINEEKNQAIISQQHTNQVVLLIGLIIIFGGAVYLFQINQQVKAKSKIINEQNQVLENNNMVKDKLFSVISHDLRSPITQVIGLLNLWEEGEMSQDEMQNLTPTVKNSIIHTLELLDNLLIWSKNQLQGFNFKPLPFDLYELTEENLQSLHRLVQKKSLYVENAVKPDTIVYADMEMIKIVLRNLISNAIKFTPAEGTIRITSSINRDYTIICVEDSGIGIKEKDQGKIFSFTSHTTLGTASEKGTGIGLKICRDFIELNNGKIWMESKENVGSKFYVSIPVDTVNALKKEEAFV